MTPKGFTGTEPGRVTDFFVPAVMNSDALTMPGYSWFRLWVRPAVGVTAAQVQQRLQQVFADDRAARAKSFPATTPQAVIDAFLREQIQLTPAGCGRLDHAAQSHTSAVDPEARWSYWCSRSPAGTWPMCLAHAPWPERGRWRFACRSARDADA